MKPAFPLQWPTGWPRTQWYHRKAGPNQMPEGRVRQLLMRELDLMHATNVVVSSDVAVRRDGMPYVNQRTPDDPGVVLYFTRKGQDIAIPCDRWKTVNANLRAIGLTVEAMRGIERWGTEQMVDRTFTGYAALPEGGIVTPPPKQDWWVVLDVNPGANAHEVKAAYREALKLHHPDVGGDPQDFAAIQQAYKDWQAQ